MPEQANKHCPRCNQTKPVTEYYLTKGKPSGYCKPCTKEYGAIRQAAKPKKKRVYNPHTRPGFKCCTVCKQELPLTEFYPNKKMQDGRLNQCSPCRQATPRKVVPKESTPADSTLHVFTLQLEVDLDPKLDPWYSALLKRDKLERELNNCLKPKSKYQLPRVIGVSFQACDLRGLPQAKEVHKVYVDPAEFVYVPQGNKEELH